MLCGFSQIKSTLSVAPFAAMAPKVTGPVCFYVRVLFVIVAKPTDLDLKMGDDRETIPWPEAWDVLFEGPSGPIAPSAQMVYDLFKERELFADTVAEFGGRFPANTHHEFIVSEARDHDGMWEISCTYLGRGGKGKGKAKGAVDRYEPY